MMMDQTTARVLSNYEQAIEYIRSEVYRAICGSRVHSEEELKEDMQMIRQFAENALQYHRDTVSKTEPGSYD